MALRIDAYRVKRGDNLGDPEFWNRILQDLDLRVHARELDGAKLDGAVDQLIAVSLQRLNDTFTPVINNAITQLESVGAKFEAESVSEVEIDVGEIEFVITPQTRSGWVVTDYVIISSIDEPDNGMICQVLAYDRTNGLLSVDALAAIGSGAFEAWRLRVSAPPDLEHATRTDNPHATTAAQVGAMTIAETNAAIAAAVSTLKGAVSGAYDTLKEIEDIVVALTTTVGGKAPNSHTHAQSEVTGLVAALAAKAELATAQTFTKPQTAGDLTLTHNTSWDGTDKQALIAAPNGSTFNIANPSALRAKTFYGISVEYASAHGLAFGTAFKGISAITPTAASGKKDFFLFRSNTAGTELHLVGEKYDIGA